jgi:hypothetical protein
MFFLFIHTASKSHHYSIQGTKTRPVVAWRSLLTCTSHTIAILAAINRTNLAVSPPAPQSTKTTILLYLLRITQRSEIGSDQVIRVLWFVSPHSSKSDHGLRAPRTSAEGGLGYLLEISE